MNISTTKGAPQVISDKLCAVYDEDSQEVIHFHRVVTLEGGETLDDDALRARAIEHAKTHEAAHGRQIISLIVDPRGFKPGCSHKVDVARRKLIAKRADGPR